MLELLLVGWGCRTVAILVELLHRRGSGLLAFLLVWAVVACCQQFSRVAAGGRKVPVVDVEGCDEA